MDIENTWRNSGKPDDMLSQAMEQNLNNIQSKLPLKKLKNNLFTGIVAGILITIGYVVLFFLFNIWQVYVALTVLIIFNAWLIVDSWKLYKNTPDTISPDLSLKQELEKNISGFQKWWRIQEKISLFVYPIAVAGGFILGGTLGSGKPVDAFLYNSRMLVILAITIAVLVPLCYLSAKWMFNYAYGKHLKQIQALISELS